MRRRFTALLMPSNWSLVHHTPNKYCCMCTNPNPYHMYVHVIIHAFNHLLGIIIIAIHPSHADTATHHQIYLFVCVFIMHSFFVTTVSLYRDQRMQWTTDCWAVAVGQPRVVLMAGSITNVMGSCCLTDAKASHEAVRKGGHDYERKCVVSKT